jgi:phosphoesterase RecJ-like protein
MDFQSALALLTKAKNILLVTHQHPDIDGAGALAAMTLILRHQGKEVLAFCEGPIPSSLDFLSPAEIFTKKWPAGFVPDIVVVLDSEKLRRLGDVVEAKLRSFEHIPLINIDHHVTNSMFGTLNIVDPNASSTCEIVFKLLTEAGFNLTPKAASFLLAGIIYDTGRFRYWYTSADTLAIAAALMRSGADLYQINEQMEKKLSLDGIHLWGDILKKANEVLDGKVIWSEVTMNMLASSSRADDVIGSELINFFLRSERCELAVLFVEHLDGIISISLRSRDKVDCTVVAKQFGGGGHARAAGCKVKGTLTEVKLKVLQFIIDNFAKIYKERGDD